MLVRCVNAPVAPNPIPVALVPADGEDARRMDRERRRARPPTKEVIAWEEWAPRRGRRVVGVGVLAAVAVAGIDVAFRAFADVAITHVR